MNDANFSKLTSCATSVLNTSFRDIKYTFPDNPLKHIENPKSMEAENVMEVRFNAEKVTLSCTFDDLEICNAAYLFFDEHNDVINYIEYLKVNYIYDYLGYCWKINQCYMSIKRIDGITCFMFYKSK